MIVFCQEHQLTAVGEFCFISTAATPEPAMTPVGSSVSIWIWELFLIGSRCTVKVLIIAKAAVTGSALLDHICSHPSRVGWWITIATAHGRASNHTAWRTCQLLPSQVVKLAVFTSCLHSVLHHQKTCVLAFLSIELNNMQYAFAQHTNHVFRTISLLVYQ